MHEPGGVDPFHDDTKLELVSSDNGDDNQPEKKLESEASVGEDDDAVTEALDSDTEPERKTRSGCMVHRPKKYDGLEMPTANIWLMQLEQSLDIKSELSLIGMAGEGFMQMSELLVVNYKQAMASANLVEW